MSTYDDRPEKTSGHDDDGLFYPKTSAGSGSGTYNAAGNDPTSSQFSSLPDATYPEGGGATSVMAPVGTGGFDDDGGGMQMANRLGGGQPARLHGGADFGLLVLRVVVGGSFVGNGLRHLFGLFHGVGRTGFENFLTVAGYEHVTVLSWVAGGTEIVAGALFVLGLFTPLAAAGMLGLMANLIVLKWPTGFFDPGYEMDLVLSAAAFAVLFAGPGRVSLDRPTPWYRRPSVNGFVFLIIAAAASVAVLLLLRHH
ncbi:MAG TPA: DoxX family protein [Pseudonocardiaceae bacterium]|nr:DoxX family protein [Pseudonocardiaceae bacterium]